MIKAIKSLFRKRSTTTLNQRGWLPAGGFGSTNGYKSIGVVNLAVRLYSDACTRFPLRVLNARKEPVDHYLLKVFNRPNSFQSKSIFFNNLTAATLLHGNFHAKIETDETGKITELLSYPARSVFAYPSYTMGKKLNVATGNSFSDPLAIKKFGYYFRDYRARIFMPYEILHIKDLCAHFDLINGISRLSQARLLWESGLSVSESIQGIAEAGFLAPTIITGAFSGDTEEKEKQKDLLEEFFQRGQAKRRRMMFLPEGQKNTNWNTHSLKMDMQAGDLEFIKRATDLDLAKLFNLQVVNNAENSPQSSAKESYRALTNVALKPWLQHLENSFTSKLLTEREQDKGIHFEYDLRTISSQDLREQSTFIKGLRECGVITGNEGRTMLGLAPHSDPEADSLQVIDKVEPEQPEMEMENDKGESVPVP